jgi:hypothetical protein
MKIIHTHTHTDTFLWQTDDDDKYGTWMCVFTRNSFFDPGLCSILTTRLLSNNNNIQ